MGKDGRWEKQDGIRFVRIKMDHLTIQGQVFKSSRPCQFLNGNKTSVQQVYKQPSHTQRQIIMHVRMQLRKQSTYVERLSLRTTKKYMCQTITLAAICTHTLAFKNKSPCMQQEGHTHTHLQGSKFRVREEGKLAAFHVINTVTQSYH